MFGIVIQSSNFYVNRARFKSWANCILGLILLRLFKPSEPPFPPLQVNVVNRKAESAPVNNQYRINLGILCDN